MQKQRRKAMRLSPNIHLEWRIEKTWKDQQIYGKEKSSSLLHPMIEDVYQQDS
jgi:hypothetical protein